MEKDGLEWENSLLPLTLTRVELSISLPSFAYGEATVDVNMLTLS